jgi:hypothetical protein
MFFSFLPCCCYLLVLVTVENQWFFLDNFMVLLLHRGCCCYLLVLVTVENQWFFLDNFMVLLLHRGSPLSLTLFFFFFDNVLYLLLVRTNLD